MTDMYSTLSAVVLFVAALALLPWLVRRLQQLKAQHQAASAAIASRVVSATAVGPQQRVVTVEVGPEGQRCWLVLGVTAQNIACLHVLPGPAATPTASSAPAAASFSDLMAAQPLPPFLQKAPHA